MKNNTKLSLGVTGAVLLVVIAFAIAAIVQAQQSRPEPAIDPETGTASAVREDSHRLDDVENATVTVVEFLDFECEACGAFYPYLEEARQEFAGRVTFVMRYFPLPSHASAESAAISVEAAARQDKLEAMYQRMFDTQAEWGEQPEAQGHVFRQYAEELGLDMEQYDQDVADPATLARVRSDFEDGRALGVTSTPTFFVNDKKVELTSFGDLRATIEAELMK